MSHCNCDSASIQQSTTFNALIRRSFKDYNNFLTFSDPPEAKPKWVVADEIPIKINDEWSWLYDAIDLDTKLILGVDLFGRHGTDPAAAFLHGFSEAVFLVDGFGYQTALARLDSAVGVSIQTET